MNDGAGSPIAYETVDHNTSRVTCIFTMVALAGIATLTVVWKRFGTAALVLAVALTLDYAIRAWTRYPSAMQRMARGLARTLGIVAKPADAAAKRFACRIGFFFALAVTALLSFFPRTAALVAATLLFFNALDGVFDFCVGCWMYTMFQRPGDVTS